MLEFLVVLFIFILWPRGFFCSIRNCFVIFSVGCGGWEVEIVVAATVKHLNCVDWMESARMQINTSPKSGRTRKKREESLCMFVVCSYMCVLCLLSLFHVVFFSFSSFLLHAAVVFSHTHSLVFFFLGCRVLFSSESARSSDFGVLCVSARAPHALLSICKKSREFFFKCLSTCFFAVVDFFSFFTACCSWLFSVNIQQIHFFSLPTLLYSVTAAAVR